MNVAVVSGPAALAWRLSEVGLFSVAMLEGPPADPCLPCGVTGVPGQVSEGSKNPTEVGVRVEEEEEEEKEKCEEEVVVVSAPSLRGCSWRTESWEREGGREKGREKGRWKRMLYYV